MSSFSKLIIHNEFGIMVDEYAVIDRLIESGLMTGLTFEDLPDIDRMSLLRKLDDYLSLFSDKSLISFGYHNILNIQPKDIRKKMGIKLVSQLSRNVKLRISSEYWKTQDIYNIKINENDKLYKLWLSPALREMVIKNGDIYKTIKEMANVIAFNEWRTPMTTYLKALKGEIYPLYPIEYDKYPWNLLITCLGIDYLNDLDLEIIGSDTSAIVKIIESVNKQRTADILRKRFKDGKTLSEIGKEYDITGGRIREIEVVGMRTIRANKRDLHRILLQYSMNQNHRILGKLRAMSPNPLRCDIETIEFLIHLLKIDRSKMSDDTIVNELISDEKVVRILQNGVLESIVCPKPVTDSVVNVETKSRKLEDALPENIRIEDLGFSVRTFNALKRGGLGTLADILSVEPEKLLKTRNLGKVSYEETINKLESMGYDVSKYPSYQQMTIKKYI